MSETIFGYSWEQIQAMQQGKKFSTRLVGFALRGFRVKLGASTFETFSSCPHYAAKSVCEAEQAPMSAVEWVMDHKTGRKVNFS